MLKYLIKNNYIKIYLLYDLINYIMKVAVCFSGGIRSFETCYPSIYKNIIKPLNADIFAHLWSMPMLDLLKEQDIVQFKLQNDECHPRDVIKKLNPKLFKVYEYNDFFENYIREKGVSDELFNKQEKKDYAVSALSMYYKIFECNKLKQHYENENNFKYDIVIRARLDFLWNDSINTNDFINVTDNDVVIIRDSYCVKAKWEGNDKFFASTSSTMDKICDLYNHINNYVKEGCELEGQNLNKYHFKKLNLNIKYLGSPNTYQKIVGRHRIRDNKHNVFFNNINSDLQHHIAYNLLYQGFNILTKHHDNSNILNLFKNFNIVNDVTQKILFYVTDDLNTINTNTKNIIYLTDKIHDNNNIDNLYIKNKILVSDKLNLDILITKIIDKNNYEFINS